MTVEELVVLWEKLKPFMNSKECLFAADAFLDFLDDHGLIDDVDSEVLNHDKHLVASFKTNYAMDDEYEDIDE